MFNSLGPIDIECDAPFYSFVEACGALGFRSPLDVRWCRISHLLEGQRKRDGGFHPLRWLFGDSRNPKTTCTCGEPLSKMKDCICTFESGKDSHYLLGQCRRCRTMFWEKISVTSRKETESDSGRT
jgi:hypothetical protein